MLELEEGNHIQDCNFSQNVLSKIWSGKTLSQNTSGNLLLQLHGYFYENFYSSNKIADE
jgi:hypothetical protein